MRFSLIRLRNWMRNFSGGWRRAVKVIATFSVGYDHIDVGAAAARGIAIANTPGVLDDATADVAILLLLGASRRAYEAQELVRSGAWARGDAPRLLGWDCAGKVLGIFGMGRIGQAVARRGRALGMKIHYSNRKRLPRSWRETRCITLRRRICCG